MKVRGCIPQRIFLQSSASHPVATPSKSVTLLLKARSKDDQRHKDYSRVGILWKFKICHYHYNLSISFAISSFRNCLFVQNRPLLGHLLIKSLPLYMLNNFIFPALSAKYDFSQNDITLEIS